MIRVAHVVTSKSWRGGEQQAVYLYEDLKALGVEQLIICTAGGVLAKLCQEKGYNHLALKLRFPLDPSYARKIAGACKSQQIDILHPHDSKAHTLSVLSVDWFKNPSDIVLERRVDFPISASAFSKYKYRHPRIKRIICVSEAIQKIMRRDIQNAEILRVVHDGIDLNKFSENTSKDIRKHFALDPSLPVIANIAALSQQKDYFTFLDTVKILLEKQQPASFLVFGDGPQKEEIYSYAREIGVFEQVNFAGFRDDLVEFIPQIDVLLFSSETEGLGTSILDCMAAKVPVVTTNAGGIPEIIRHKENGFMGRVKDPASLAEGVAFVLNHKKEAQAWMEQAFTDVQAFSRESMARKTLAVYQEVKD